MSHVNFRVNELTNSFPESSVDGRKRIGAGSLRDGGGGREKSVTCGYLPEVMGFRTAAVLTGLVNWANILNCRLASTRD